LFLLSISPGDLLVDRLGDFFAFGFPSCFLFGSVLNLSRGFALLGDFIFFARAKKTEAKESAPQSVAGSAGSLRYSEISGRSQTRIF